ncbi:MAG: hypothetical protein ABJE95_06695 [Byssovorax sp.]
MNNEEIDETDETEEPEEAEGLDEANEAGENDDVHEGDIVDPESLPGAIAALVDMYYLDEILVVLAREIQAKGEGDDGQRGDALRSDARALRKAIGKLSGET